MPKLILLQFVFFLTTVICIPVHSQVNDYDPFLGDYVIGNNEELNLLYADPDNDGVLKSKVFGFDNTTLYPELRDSMQFTGFETQYGDICIGELNGDLKDDIVTALIKKNLTDPMRYDILLITENDEFSAGEILMSDRGPLFKVFIADFDYEPRKEILLAYYGNDYHLHINVYKTDSALNIIEISSDISLSISPLLEYEAYFTACPVDVDNDAIDEIAIVRNMSPVVGEGSELKTAKFDFNLAVFDCSLETYELSRIGYQDLQFTESDHTEFRFDSIARLERLAMTAGNITGDRTNELIIAYSYKYIDIRSTSSDRQGVHCSMVPIGISKTDITKEAIDLNYIIADTCRLLGYRSFKEEILEHPTMEYPLEIVCEDVNLDGYDDIFSGSVGGIRLDCPLNENQELSFVYGGFIDADAYIYNNITPRTFIVADIDADTLDIDLSDSTKVWKPEVVVVGYQQDYESIVSYNDTLRISTYEFSATDYFPFVRLNNSPTTVMKMPAMENKFYCIASGDIDGDGLRFGKPNVIEQKMVNHPTVILNAPPFHFDVLDGQKFDICMAYVDTIPFRFKATYESIDGESSLFRTTLRTDWARSAHFTSKYIVAGSGINRDLETRYGENFNKVESHQIDREITDKATAARDDYVYNFRTTYKIWEYPVYYRKKLLGYVAALNPILDTQTEIWKEGRAWNQHGHLFNHEVGNILSYAGFTEESLPLEIDNFQGTYSISSTSSFSKEIKYSNIVNDHTELTRFSGGTLDKFTRIGYEGEVSAEISVEPFGVGMSFGVSFGIELGYQWGTGIFCASDEVTTQSTTIADSWRLLIELGHTNGYLGQAAYEVTPYVYWSDDGALVLDYYVEPNDTWWDYHYGTLPDLAFILPNRYLTEKGGAFTPGYEYQRYHSPDIMINPTIPVPGDSLEILARVHNFSLANVGEKDSVAVKFYYGDPDNGGIPVPNITKEGRSWKYDIKQPRSQTYFYIECIAPENISEIERIYAVIELVPDDLKDKEVHYNNNKGYFDLTYEESNVVTNLNRNNTNHTIAVNNYPNPFRTETTISFTLLKPEKVHIELYNISGQKLRTITNQVYLSGTQTIPFIRGDLKMGVYFYKTTIGNYSETRKMIILD